MLLLILGGTNMNINNLNTHLLYFSPTGTTQQVVTAIGKGIGGKVTHHDLTLPSNRNISNTYKENDLLIIGMPIYSGRVPSTMEPIIKTLKGSNTPTVLVAVYGNCNIGDILVEMQDYLTEGGFKPFAGATFLGEHSLTPLLATNRPDAQDIDIALSFGESIYQKLQTIDLNSIQLTLCGNRPYKERKPPIILGPTINDTCTLCNQCISHCPTGALTLGKGKVLIDPSLCISCHSCVKICPVGAVSFGGHFPEIRDRLLRTFTERKEPELYMFTQL